MDKKGVELTLNYVVLIALAVIALIVILLIFSGGMTEFVQKLKGVMAEIWATKPNMTATKIP